MQDLTMEKIEQSRRDRSAAHRKLLEHSACYKHFLELERTAFADGAVSSKQKELTALAISIVAKCEPCIEWHVGQALRLGAGEPEIYETIEVAMEMGGGPAVAYARLAIRAIEYHTTR